MPNRLVYLAGAIGAATVLNDVRKAVRYPACDLRGKRVLVTGAAMGLGRTVALKFARRGADLMLWDINEAKLLETIEVLQKEVSGLSVRSQKVNLASRNDIYRCSQIAIETWGHPQLIVNNAGVVTGSLFLSSPDERNELTMRVNCLAHMWMAKAFLPGMIKAREGHIIDVASVAAFLPAPGMVDYAASKAGAVAFAEGLALELRSQHIDEVYVSVVCPAHIATELFKGFGFNKFYDVTLTVDEVADAVVRTAEKDHNSLVVLPNSMGVVWALKGLVNGLGGYLGLPLLRPANPMKKWNSKAAEDRWNTLDNARKGKDNNSSSREVQETEKNQGGSEVGMEETLGEGKLAAKL